jgi:signal transduction histidine kinase
MRRDGDLMPRTGLRPLQWVALLLALLGLALDVYIFVRAPAVVPANQKPNLALYLGTAVGTLEFVLVGLLVTRRQPRNVIGWMLLAIGIGISLTGTSDYNLFAPYAPAAFPYAGAVSTFGAVLGQPTLGLLLIAFLVFPDGRLLSRRWLPFVLLGVVSDVMATAGAILDPRVLSGSTISSAGQLAQELESLGWFGLLLAGASGVVSMFVRYRRGTVEVREQLKWVFAGVFVTVASLWVATALDAFTIPLLVTVVLLPATIGFAVLKYRLYDIDVVISRTVVYGALAIAIAAVYVGLVVGIGSIVGRGTGANLVLSLVATAIVALAFQPARARLQRAANRLVYGKRATPYEVLSDFSERVAEAYATEELLPRMARVLGEGTGAERSEVWLRIADELRRVAAWPDTATASPPPVAVTGERLPSLDAGHTVPVRHRGELLGALTINKRAGETLTPIEAKLLDDLANQAGLMLRNVGLTEALMEKVQELRASRQRLVAAQDQERRRLERNLHDGAQQHLVALKVNLGLAKHFAASDPGKTTELLTQLEAAADETLDTLRALARGIYPPLLADQGLATALEAHARKATLPVEIDADGIGRYPQEVEAAVYFCCLEALQNVQKYAHASTAAIRLSAGDGGLRFSVTDDGEGFDPRTRRRGAGLQNMADRLDALGGDLTITAAPAGGTTVTGILPAVIPAASSATTTTP